jgi:nitrogen regulatory protein PII
VKQVIAFIKPHQLSPVAMGLRDIPELTGMSISKGQGFGRGRARGEGQRIVEDEMAYISHVRIEVFCSDEWLEEVVACIAGDAHTGLSGDGKIYVTEVVEAVRISNGERGLAAI